MQTIRYLLTLPDPGCPLEGPRAPRRQVEESHKCAGATGILEHARVGCNEAGGAHASMRAFPGHAELAGFQVQSGLCCELEAA